VGRVRSGRFLPVVVDDADVQRCWLYTADEKHVHTAPVSHFIPNFRLSNRQTDRARWADSVYGQRFMPQMPAPHAVIVTACLHHGKRPDVILQRSIRSAIDIVH
jgi:hypothetical protein